ncbi:hypothetical protein MuYL_0552 [Mucilaginibacter xinganensis]|uniref:Secretion system C-terminal sorting domain-containing protein n=1 Tax=Mucilaginibacter xinganensis TaxID=1234841 RepID=A0A223NRC1_9SPHI|nr:hypothetical protein MuYL_0552 [Mucilaginibacter xinganensis]
MAANPLNISQTAIAVYGFSVRTTSTTTFTGFTFSATQTIGTYFSNFKIYSSTNTTYTAGTDPIVTGASIVVGATTISITIPTATVNSGSTATNFFLVADYTVASSTSSTFQFALTGTTSSAAYTGGTQAGINYTLSASTCDWVGNTSNAWATPGNWQAGRVPGTYDAVQIAVNYSPNSTNSVPVVSTSTNIGSLTFGGLFTSGGVNFPGVSVNTGKTLAVSGDINVIVDANPGSYTYTGTPVVAPYPTTSLPTNQFLIKGAGTLSAVNFNINANYDSQAAQSTQQAVISSITNLVLSGNMVLTSENYRPGGTTYNQVASFYLTDGTTDIAGKVKLVNTVSGTTTYPVSGFMINPTTSAGATLQLDNATPWSLLTANGSNYIDLNNTYAEVNYAGTGQTITTSTAITGLPSGLTYYDLTLSGGTQTPAAGTLTVGHDFTTTSTAANFNTNNTVLTVSDISYINGGTMNLGSGTFTSTNGIDIYGTSVLNGGSGNIVDGNFFRVNNDLSNATVNLGSGTTTIANAAQFFGGTTTCGTGAVSITQSTQIYTGATLNAGSASGASLTFTGSYQNFSGGAFTAGGGSVFYNGSYSNSGTFTAGTGTVYFNLAGAQALSDNSTAGTTFNKVNFQNSGTKTMSGTKGFAVSNIGVLTMAGTASLAAGGVLTLRSDATGTATVAAIPAACSVTGTVKVERYITGGAGYRGYRILSSPVSVGTDGSGNKIWSIDYIVNSTYVSGTSFPATATSKVGNPCFYLYRENLAPTYSSFLTSNNRGIKSIASSPSYTIDIDGGPYSIPVGNGVMYFFRGSTTTTSPYTSSSTPVAATVTASGTLTQGNVQVVDWYNPTSTTLSVTTLAGNASVRGLNLIGNPYASPIDWSKFSSTVATNAIYGPNVNPTIYELKPGTNAYGTYNALTTAALNNGSPIVSSGQGFFVQANNSGTATLKFTENAKTLVQPSGFTYLAGASTENTAYNQYMILNISKDTTSKSEILIGLNAGSGKKYNHIEDDKYFASQNLAQSMWITSADSINLVSKWMPMPKAKLADTAFLTVKAATSGRYTIARSDLKPVPALYDIWLMDNYKKDSLDIKHNSTYAFDVNLADTNSFGAHRFQVIIRQNPALGVHLLNFAAVKATAGAKVSWKTENEADYTHFAVERSTDNGVTFTQLNTVVSSFQQTYSFVDENPPIAVNQYRLKLTDLDGTVTYSKVVTLMYSTLSNIVAYNPISIYPNPTKGNLNVSITPNTLSLPTSGDYSFNIVITGSNGVVVKKAITSQLEWQDNVASLTPGSYVVQIINNKDKSVVGKTKFVKM